MSGWGYAIGAATEATAGYFQSRSAKREAARNRKFQERMYKNRYTYAVDDLKRAGLNPMLAAGSLGGGASPAGAMANIAKADMGAAASSAQRARTEMKIAKETINQIKADTELKKNQASLAGNQSVTELSRQLEIVQNIQESVSRVMTNEANAKSLTYDNVYKGVYANMVKENPNMALFLKEGNVDMKWLKDLIKTIIKKKGLK